MADKVSTDIASEVNITARRGDTFILEISALNTGVDQVTGVVGAVLDTNTDSIADTIIMNNSVVQYTGTSGTTGSSTASEVRWGAKMTIGDNTSGTAKLSVFSPYYGDAVFSAGNNVLPSATVEGKYYGTAADAGGINLEATSTATGKIKITIPAAHMAALEPGTYSYDFQVRKKVWVGLVAEITTWLYGSFTINADVTSGTA